MLELCPTPPCTTYVDTCTLHMVDMVLVAMKAQMASKSPFFPIENQDNDG